MEIVTLRLYRGEEKYNKEGKLISESQLYKVSHGTHDWNLFKKNIGYTFTSAEIVAVNKQSKELVDVEENGVKRKNTLFSYESVDISDTLKAEVHAIFNAPKKELTPEQKQIAELKAQLDALTNASKAKPVVKEAAKAPVSKENSEELESLRSEYAELFGKKPSHLMKVESLKKAINEKQNS